MLNWIKHTFARIKALLNLDHKEEETRPPEWLEKDEIDPVDEAAWESFPASDPPATSIDRTRE